VRTIELNGRIPDLADTRRLATANYGHYTSMQVRDGGVRGLALHFARMADANEEFFGWTTGLDDEHRLRELIRHALGDTADASVQVRFAASADPATDLTARPDVLVIVGDPVPDTPRPPLRVRTDPFRRHWPDHKNAATMGLTYAARRAALAGYDDALFVGAGNLVTEGTTWNLALHDGDQVIWPQAPMLKGITMVLLQIALSMRGTPWTMRPVDAAELPLMAGAAAVNSICPAQPIAGVDGVPFPADDKLTRLLLDAWQSVPFDTL
jgi:branched-subunit amino acid aminotransferase/4-amino-4-deoxychorismate lyase